MPRAHGGVHARFAQDEPLAPLTNRPAWRALVVVTEAAFLVGVVLLPLMQFANVHTLGTQMIPSDLCFGLAAVGVLILELSRRGAALRGPFAFIVAAYLAALMAAALASPDQQESFKRILIDSYCVVLGTTAFVLARDAATRVRIAWAYIAGSAATAAVALVGVALFYAGERNPTENFAIGNLGSIHTTAVPRVVGFFLNSNMFCNYLVVGLLFTLGMVGWRRPVGIALTGAIGIALAFTLSPGLGGACVAIALWLFVSERGWARPVGVLVVAAGASGAIMFLVLTLTVGPRASTWSDAFQTLWAHPLVGVGPGFPVAATTYQGRFFTDAHNAWLNVGGQAGFLGLLALVGVVALVCVLAWKARPIGDIPEPVRAGWCAFVGAVLFGSLSLSLEQNRHVWVLIGFLAAGLSAARGRSRASQN